MHMCFCRGKARESTNLQNLGGDGKIPLKLIFKKYDGDLDRIVLAQNR